MQVIRTKHKIKAFHIAARAAAGCMASLSLALGNNTLEVCAQSDLSSDSSWHGALFMVAGFPSFPGMHCLAPSVQGSEFAEAVSPDIAAQIIYRRKVCERLQCGPGRRGQ